MDDPREPATAQAQQIVCSEELGTPAPSGATLGAPATALAAGELPVRPPPLPPQRPAPSELWQAFFKLNGGSLLYCLSALFITFGIAKMLLPLLADAETIRATLPCLTALNVYELTLLGTLLFIVLRENVTDDAISLVVLSPAVARRRPRRPFACLVRSPL